jgi:hypothetical protein
MKGTIAIGGVALGAWLALCAPGTAAPRVAEGTKVFKGPMDPYGSIRFQALPSKRGKVPRLDRFNIRFSCNDGTPPTGLGYGAAPGSSIRPDRRGRFRIGDHGSDLDLAINGDFNRRYTKASGTFRFDGAIVDGIHSECHTGRVTWKADLQP